MRLLLKTFYKNRKKIIASSFLSGLCLLTLSVPVFAAPSSSSSSSSSSSCKNTSNASKDASSNGQNYSVTCLPNIGNCVDQNNSAPTACNNSIIANYLDPVINFLSVGVGIVVVITIVVGGIQYTTSAGSPDQAAAAKNRIMDGLIALVAFALMYGVLQFFVPGGLFNSSSSSSASSSSSSSSSSFAYPLPTALNSLNMV